MSEEYEIVSHNNVNFRIFLVNMLYRSPHVHTDFEILAFLNGSARILTRKGASVLKQGDLCVLDPLDSHEIIAHEPATILSLQVPPARFHNVFPQLEKLSFTETFLFSEQKPRDCSDLVRRLCAIARAQFRAEEYSPLLCSSLIDDFFYHLLLLVPHEQIPEKAYAAAHSRGSRIHRILELIETRFDENISLKEIAEAENTDYFYMSHFFKDTCGMSFQEYLSHKRCEFVRRQLLLTDDSLLDICIASGFSDGKYMNRDFRKLYGVTPKEYRSNFQRCDPERQCQSLLTTQEFLSDKTTLVLLDQLQPA
ncbi:MAG: AraC family transcriptional regulator [Lachnospiraceae bacterium]|jgi:AraC-like DNA-binding protein|nr:AraC family transcriptional regulator [Lachnospiraceae bacterium]